VRPPPKIPTSLTLLAHPQLYKKITHKHAKEKVKLTFFFYLSCEQLRKIQKEQKQFQIPVSSSPRLVFQVSSRLSQDHEPPPAFENVTAEAAETQKVKANTKPSNLATSTLIAFTSSIYSFTHHI